MSEATDAQDAKDAEVRATATAFLVAQVSIGKHGLGDITKDSVLMAITWAEELHCQLAEREQRLRNRMQELRRNGLL